LLDETGDARWATIPALVLTGATDIGGLYRQMVDENVIRKDLSFAEMARAAQTYAMDPETGANDLSDAVAALFQSAPYSKRSYIRSFAYLLDQIGPYLAYPTEIARALKDRPKIKARIRDDLHDWTLRGVLDELDVLRRHAGQDPIEVDGEVHIITATSKPKRGAVDPSKTKTTFDIRTSAGRVKCTAAVGRLEIKVDRDFSTIDRARLERAIAGLVDGLG
jgi:ParB family chromosome partitioning protein